jgi:hypothetical protein
VNHWLTNPHATLRPCRRRLLESECLGKRLLRCLLAALTRGGFQQDPPGYWEKCVWPAYLSAHAPLFVDGDVETGAIDPQQGIELFETQEMTMDDMVNRVCERIYAEVQNKSTAAAEPEANGH